MGQDRPGCGELQEFELVVLSAGLEMPNIGPALAPRFQAVPGQFCSLSWKVTILVRGASLRHTLSEYLVERVTTAPNIEVQTHTRVVALQGDSRLRQIIVLRTGQRPQTLPTSWLFVCAGGEPRTARALQGGLQLDPDGYILTGPDLLVNGRMEGTWPLSRLPYYLETNVPGMFAAGDVRHGPVKRCASAVGKGAMAVTFAHRFLAERRPGE